MKPLRELPANSPLIAQVQRLIEAAPVIAESPAHMQRVRRALDQTPARGTSLLVRAPGFAVAGALLVFGASAFAAVRVWVEHRGAESAPAAEPLPAAPTARASERVRSIGVAAPPPSAASEPAPDARAEARLVAADEPVRSRVQPAVAHKRKHVRRHGALRTRSSVTRIAAKPVLADGASHLVEADESTPLLAAASASAPTTTAAARSEERPAGRSEEAAAAPEPERFSRAEKRSSDSELVVQAVQTLRRDHDALLAARLLEKYRTRNPAGVLAEEVLSLQVEAAMAAGDPRARSFAREYLSRYPDGRYRERASRALVGAAP